MVQFARLTAGCSDFYIFIFLYFSSFECGQTRCLITNEYGFSTKVRSASFATGLQYSVSAHLFLPTCVSPTN